MIIIGLGHIVMILSMLRSGLEDLVKRLGVGLCRCRGESGV